MFGTTIELIDEIKFCGTPTRIKIEQTNESIVRVFARFSDHSEGSWNLQNSDPAILPAAFKRAFPGVKVAGIVEKDLSEQRGKLNLGKRVGIIGESVPEEGSGRSDTSDGFHEPAEGRMKGEKLERIKGRIKM